MMSSVSPRRGGRVCCGSPGCLPGLDRSPPEVHKERTIQQAPSGHALVAETREECGSLELRDGPQSHSTPLKGVKRSARCKTQQGRDFSVRRKAV